MVKKMKDPVRFVPSVQSNTPVRHNGNRYLVYVDPDDDNEDVSAPVLEREVADQLVKAGVGDIHEDDRLEDDGDDGDDLEDEERDATSGNVAANAARRLRRYAGADQAGQRTSGADSRDTTHFPVPPLGARSAEAGSDAPPLEGKEGGRTQRTPPTKAQASKRGAKAAAPKAPRGKKSAPAPTPSPASSGSEGGSEGTEGDPNADAPAS